MIHKPIELSELMATRSGSVNPASFLKEEFELFSIPAFDVGAAEIKRGEEIGSSKQCVEPGDVLLSKIVPHIRRAWIVSPTNGRRQIASSEWIVFRNKRIHAKFLRQLLVGDVFHAMFMNTVAGVGGSLLRARPAHVAKIKVPLPPLSEQKLIAEILDRAESLRRQRRAALALLDELTQSIFLDMFGDPTLASKDTMTTLAEATDFITGFAFKSKEFVGSQDAIRLCRGANVLPNRIDWSDVVYWPLKRVDEVEKFQLCAGDVIIAMDRPWISSGFKIAQISNADCPSLLVQRVARLRGTRVSNSFLYQLLKQPAFTRHCRPTETTIPHISPTDILTFAFSLPDPRTQEKFDQRLIGIDRMRVEILKSASASDALFASLQHRVFRGEL